MRMRSYPRGLDQCRCAQNARRATERLCPLLDYSLRAAGRDDKVLFLFANHTLDTDRRELRRGAHTVAVEPQVFDLLIYLMQHRERVVSKDDIIAAVWGGRVVSDSTLTSRINAARTAIGDNGEEQKLIRTFAR